MIASYGAFIGYFIGAMVGSFLEYKTQYYRTKVANQPPQPPRPEILGCDATENSSTMTLEEFDAKLDALEAQTHEMLGNRLFHTFDDCKPSEAFLEAFEKRCSEPTQVFNINQAMNEDYIQEDNLTDLLMAKTLRELRKDAKVLGIKQKVNGKDLSKQQLVEAIALCTA
ncbi:MAG: hypothetical protein ACRDEA_02455 [Microcystaceae cyanobacterium]